MKTATLVFTYNRSRHTAAVLEALSKNSRLPEKLFVFQDGYKNNGDLEEWQKVNKLIRGIEWCEAEIIVSEGNRGLAASIVSGITYVFQKYDAIIVLEDDCVPSVSFMDFMYQCLEKYDNNKKIFSVSGYAYPVALEKGTHDIYGCGRVSSWGWGTWKDRWQYFEKDYELVKKLRQEKESSRNLAMWGMDLESMLVGNIRGECDSWAAFWALKGVEKEGICINPYESLIRNIGLDGSGANCGVTDYYDVLLMDKNKQAFDLPDEVYITEKTVEAFAPLFGSYTALNGDKGEKEKILVYGLGNYYLRTEERICGEYYVEAFVDRVKKGWFAGKPIIKSSDIAKYKYDKILVMILNNEDCLEVKEAAESTGDRAGEDIGRKGSVRIMECGKRQIK